MQKIVCCNLLIWGERYILSRVFVPDKLLTFGHDTVEYKLSPFWNYWNYWGSSSPLTSLDLWQHLCDMNDGVEGRMVVQEEGETLAKVFSDRILSPQAVGTGAVRGTKAFTFYSFSNSHHLPSCSTNNWSLWRDQSSFSRLTNSGFFSQCSWWSYVFNRPEQLYMYPPQIAPIICQCTWRQSNSGHFSTWPWTTFILTMQPKTMIVTMHMIHSSLSN